MKGTVVWFKKKGIGFARRDGMPAESKGDVFLHYEHLDMPGFKMLYKGDRIEFDCVRTPKGLQARNVRRIQSWDGVT